MPFNAIETVKAPEKLTRASISYRKKMNKTGRSRQPKLVIGIPKSHTGSFKAKDGATFALLLGEGKDAGKARIQPTTAGGVAVRMLKGGAVFHFGFVPMLGDDQAEKEFVDVKSVDNGFEIALPAWFKADTK